MKNLFKPLAVGVVFCTVASCTPSNEVEYKNEVPEKDINLPVSGTYSWTFTIPEINSVQKSTIKFSNENIEYKMVGAAHNDAYTLKIYSFNALENKIIARMEPTGNAEKDANRVGKYTVIFLKDIQPKSMMVYKTVPSKGFESLKEAKEMPVPAEKDTSNHGWNLYEKEF